MAKGVRYFIISIFCVCVLLSSCSSMGGVQFQNDESAETEKGILRGKPYQTASVDDDITVTMTAQPTYDADEVQVTVGISNRSDSNYYFEDRNITLFRGNSQTGKWTNLGRWDANKYYQEAYNEAKLEESLAAAAAILAVVDSAMGTTSRSVVNTPYGRAAVTTHTYSPVDTALTAMAGSAYYDSVASNNEYNIQSLDRVLLYSSTIDSNTNYVGNLFIKADRHSPEYKISLYNEKGDPVDFIFSRSDRDIISNPWKDQLYDRHSIVFSHAIPQDRMQLTYYWSRRDKVGMYAGLAFYNIFKVNIKTDDGPGIFYNRYSNDWGNYGASRDPDPNDQWKYSWYYDWKASKTGEIAPYFSIGFPLGITYRLFSNTWLVAGVEIGVNSLSYERYTLKYKNPNGEVFDYPGEYWTTYYPDVMYISPQLGFNCIFNWIDFSAVLTYRYPLNFYFDVGIGVAF